MQKNGKPLPPNSILREHRRFNVWWFLLACLFKVVELAIAVTIFGIPIAIALLPVVGIIGKKAFRKL